MAKSRDGINRAMESFYRGSFIVGLIGVVGGVVVAFAVEESDFAMVLLPFALFGVIAQIFFMWLDRRRER